MRGLLITVVFQPLRPGTPRSGSGSLAGGLGGAPASDRRGGGSRLEEPAEPGKTCENGVSEALKGFANRIWGRVLQANSDEVRSYER